MNSLILNSPTGYLRLAGRDRCAFYDTMITDLLRTKEGKIERVFIQYQDQEGQNIYASVPKHVKQLHSFKSRSLIQQSKQLILKFLATENSVSSFSTLGLTIPRLLIGAKSTNSLMKQLSGRKTPLCVTPS